ncbi:MAG: hypothetical protein GWM98_14795 [Nitrospinaceae bacterium]|nr:hypothetical protein [Nitrospinaceae bacterium]NIR55515.1 hypothetical protein [Nitrospinaceae bacterium]NIS87296.1 hypothetical protein [Nitrospinaceae bacterium]NIT82795.1 hypothetical protein [Nitrospinaceae bacterium]NIU46336.1 hypothetical protein [Nitrospinaceae bacterium]
MKTIREKKVPACAVQSFSAKPCSGEVQEVVLIDREDSGASRYPRRIDLCQFHHQLELMVWGVKTFFDRYPLAGPDSDPVPRGSSRKRRQADGGDWRQALLPEPDDASLYFSPPEDLEFWMDRVHDDRAGGDFQPRAGYEHLKETFIDLDQVQLTDKQLMAVCMVFYGGVKKNRAARAMKITSQALSDHIKAALKKIEENIIHP